MAGKTGTLNRSRVRNMLLNLRKEMINKIDANIAGGNAVSSADDNDVATYNAEGSLSLSLATMESETLHQIDEALAKIESGEYGLCGICGEEIGEARLRAIPHADLCIKCKALLEQGLI